MNGEAHQSTFFDNHAFDGGGAYNAVLTQCILSNNMAMGEGGAACGGSLTNVLLGGN